MKNILEFKRLYFIGLFSGIVYFPIITIILGKIPLKDVSFTKIMLISLSAMVITGILYLRFTNKLFYYYKFALFLGHIPLMLGFLFSLVEKNYLYLLICFPVFLVSYIALIPSESK